MKFYHFFRILLFIILITVLSWRYYDGDTRAKMLPVEPIDEITEEIIHRSKKVNGSLGGWLRRYTHGGVVPAVAAGIVCDDELIIHGGKNANLDTPFGIASLTKTFTAVLLLQLEDEGIVRLDNPVRNYLPGLVIERVELGSPPVTITHLLSHTSGMPDYGREVRAVVNGRTIFHKEQRYPAGYHYAYSNRGYMLLKHLIEEVTGISYAENLSRRIFRPLGMRSSSGIRSNGTGGITTTIRDLSRYAAMLLNRGKWHNRRIISEAAYRKMLASAVELPRTRSDYHYSLGWEVMTANNSIDSYYKAGRWYGAASGLQIYPKKKVALLYLCNPPNHLSSSFMSWRNALTGKLRGLLKYLTEEPRLCTWPDIGPGILKSYVGEYVNVQTGQTITVLFRGNILFCRKYGVLEAMKTFSSNRFIVGPRRLLNFVWKDSRVVGLAARDGYYHLKSEL